MKTDRLLTLFTLFICISASASRKVHVIESSNLHCVDTVVVYSPELAAMERGLPTLFLLHGAGGNWSNWEKVSDLQVLCDKFGFRIICPDGFADGWYINKTDQSGTRWRDFFWEELWSLMEAEYGLDPAETFVDGLSMGGHGAMNIFLDRPDLFAGAGSMSGTLDLKYSGAKERIPAMIGAKHIEDTECKAMSAINRLERVSEICGEDAVNKLLVISCGLSDAQFLPAAEDFEHRCRELGLNHIALFSPGGHLWDYWTWLLPIHIELFSQHLKIVNLTRQ
ncbi:MAG: alpha/beta hydrolase [Candidatus Cryptobacteroides sp.]